MSKDEGQRVIVWVSAGVPSACAWKVAVDLYGASRVHGVYCDVAKTEHPDNERFLKQVSDWVGQPLTRIKSEKYNTIDEVFEDRKYMAGIKGAPCTVQMKKVPRFNFQRADDIHVFGFTREEERRVDNFKSNNPELFLQFLLVDREYSRRKCMDMIASAGIALPVRYSQGFVNNNCLCCVKASSLAYWIMERRVNPEVFARRAEQSRRLGARLVRWGGKRIFLDELPPDKDIITCKLPAGYSVTAAQIKRSTESISCGPECRGVSLDINDY